SELILTLSELAADADWRKQLRKGVNTGHSCELGAKLLNNFLSRLALVAGLHANEHAAGVPASSHRHERINPGLLHHDSCQRELMLHHAVEGNPLRAFGEDEDLPLILVGQKAFRYGDE